MKPTPTRIQRKRTKGWRMPPNTCYCGRGSKWGNPFKVGAPVPLYIWWMYLDYADMVKYKDNTPVPDSKEAVRLYRKYARPSKRELDELRKYDHLACWCRLDAPCHIDVIIEMLNRDK